MGFFSNAAEWITDQSEDLGEGIGKWFEEDDEPGLKANVEAVEKTADEGGPAQAQAARRWAAVARGRARKAAREGNELEQEDTGPTHARARGKWARDDEREEHTPKEMPQSEDPDLFADLFEGTEQDVPAAPEPSAKESTGHTREELGRDDELARDREPAPVEQPTERTGTETAPAAHEETDPVREGTVPIEAELATDEPGAEDTGDLIDELLNLGDEPFTDPIDEIFGQAPPTTEQAEANEGRDAEPAGAEEGAQAEEPQIGDEPFTDPIGQIFGQAQPTTEQAGANEGKEAEPAGAEDGPQAEEPQSGIWGWVSGWGKGTEEGTGSIVEDENGQEQDPDPTPPNVWSWMPQPNVNLAKASRQGTNGTEHAREPGIVDESMPTPIEGSIETAANRKEQGEAVNEQAQRAADSGVDIALGDMRWEKRWNTAADWMESGVLATKQTVKDIGEALFESDPNPGQQDFESMVDEYFEDRRRRVLERNREIDESGGLDLSKVSEKAREIWEWIQEQEPAEKPREGRAPTRRENAMQALAAERWRQWQENHGEQGEIVRPERVLDNGSSRADLSFESMVDKYFEGRRREVLERNRQIDESGGLDLRGMFAGGSEGPDMTFESMVDKYFEDRRRQVLERNRQIDESGGLDLSGMFAGGSEGPDMTFESMVDKYLEDRRRQVLERNRQIDESGGIDLGKILAGAVDVAEGTGDLGVNTMAGMGNTVTRFAGQIAQLDIPGRMEAVVEIEILAEKVKENPADQELRAEARGIIEGAKKAYLGERVKEEVRQANLEGRRWSPEDLDKEVAKWEHDWERMGLSPEDESGQGTAAALEKIGERARVVTVERLETYEAMVRGPFDYQDPISPEYIAEVDNIALKGMLWTLWATEKAIINSPTVGLAILTTIGTGGGALVGIGISSVFGLQAMGEVIANRAAKKGEGEKGYENLTAADWTAAAATGVAFAFLERFGMMVGTGKKLASAGHGLGGSNYAGIVEGATEATQGIASVIGSEIGFEDSNILVELMNSRWDLALEFYIGYITGATIRGVWRPSPNGPKFDGIEIDGKQVVSSEEVGDATKSAESKVAGEMDQPKEGPDSVGYAAYKMEQDREAFEKATEGSPEKQRIVRRQGE